ncbi:pectate lyase superfamily protein-domain-containing protein, partial [Xylogone sp. PMI_703]
MVDNADNSHGVAPDHYTLPKPKNHTQLQPLITEATLASGGGYWLANMEHGKSPFASAGYQVWRNVKDFGAKGDGVTDDTEAINNAATSGGRCGLDCGSTTIGSAIVYFPAGTYMVSTPILQYYFTQFIGDPTNLPTIKGLPNFQGIALIDTDVYIPGGNGSEWYINQNQFFRQIRNFNIDLTAMPNQNQAGDQTYVPTGIHWQVAQSTSLQNIHVTMPQGGTHVGIFTENGSGGFVSDLTFFGGNIGMRVGSQQFTARDITFDNCAVAVSMIWDWGWTWKNIEVIAAYKAFEATNFGGVDGQGTGSLTIIDSHFIDTPFAIPISRSFTPAITIDNLLVEGNTPQIVFFDGSTDNLLAGTSGGSLRIQSWATGRRYLSITDPGTSATGDLNPAPDKPAQLLDSSGSWFVRSKPQYETFDASSFLNALDHGAVGDGVHDDGGALSELFAACADNDQICFIPHGVYMTSETVDIPIGARIVGEAWPQIMGTGPLFADASHPVPVVRVGDPGGSGVVEISDVLFTVSGPTPGAILVEWNVHESSQGSAALWDSHFRVGGAFGTKIGPDNCPASAAAPSDCFGASLLLHVTPGASGYFENVWLWVADHYLDDPSQAQINSLSGRGLLVDQSQGPNWFWASASEHSVFYQYSFQNSSNIFIGHMQTETPYFQPAVSPLGIFPNNFNGDPNFADCVESNQTCSMAWALLMAHSSDIFIYGAGFYSFFDSYNQDCLGPENCQNRLVQTDFSQGIWMYSQYTKGVTECVSPLGGVLAVNQADNRNGYLTAISAWLPLALTGAEIGAVDNSSSSS